MTLDDAMNLQKYRAEDTQKDNYMVEILDDNISLTPWIRKIQNYRRHHK
ncbi:MAG: hypothetical protein Ct9H90mP13_11440 [Pseudomonadota bacterium]|nr:MAG: hypothetical protein Ct9H90mP13_11440 [Pseudomonadota bacterium]